MAPEAENGAQYNPANVLMAVERVYFQERINQNFQDSIQRLMDDNAVRRKLKREDQKQQIANQKPVKGSLKERSITQRQTQIESKLQPVKSLLEIAKQSMLP